MHPRAVILASLSLMVLGLECGPTLAQTTQFEDLQGKTINTEVVYDRRFRRDGVVRSNLNHTLIKLVIGPGDAIQQTHTVRIVARDGREIANRTSNLTFALGKPLQGREGHLVWLFEDGSLTRLQTLIEGGRRFTITFAKTEQGLTCKIDAAFAKEEGVGDLQTGSVVGPGQVKWLDSKVVSTSCRITKS